MDLQRGQPVEVRNEFTGSWTGGFEVIDAVAVRRHDGSVVEYRVKRCSDGSVLPSLFSPKRVRPLS
jgi:hypothetical protein